MSDTAGKDTEKKVSEEAKNHAILFFLDHLMAKDGTRTIHDLSCQFGSRGFTQEMRDAVGGTQESLTDFLGQYPSLFTVDGDQVTMKMFGDMANGSSKASPLLRNLQKDRDYDREAVEFFEAKLQKFGPERQIKSLLGHRSQAAPEIRLVSGRHVKDFTEFLMGHTEAFVIEADRIRLRNMPEPTAPAPDVDEDGQPLIGNRAKLAALDFLRAVLEGQEAPVPLEQVYRHFCDRFSHAVRQEVATNPKELLYFLKLNRSVFFIRSNKVSLVRFRPEDGEGDDELSGITPFGADSVSDLDTASNTSSSMGRDEILDQLTIVNSVTAGVTAVEEIRELITTGSASDGGGSSGGSKSASPAPPPVQFKTKVFAVDHKLITLGDQEFVSLIIISTPVLGHLYLFDMAHSALPLTETGLKDLLESEDYVKVIHDCRRFSLLLNKQYNIMLRNVYDTQVANAVLQHQRTGRPVDQIREASFQTLQRLYHPESLLYSRVRPKKSPNAIKPEMNSLLQEMCREYVEYYINEKDVQARQKKRQLNHAMHINDKMAQDGHGFNPLLGRELNYMDRNGRMPNDCIIGPAGYPLSIGTSADLAFQAAGFRGPVLYSRAAPFGGGHSGPGLVGPPPAHLQPLQALNGHALAAAAAVQQAQAQHHPGVNTAVPPPPLIPSTVVNPRALVPSMSHPMPSPADTSDNWRMRPSSHDGLEQVVPSGLPADPYTSPKRQNSIPTPPSHKPQMCEAACQTYSTGDIIITSTYEEN